MSVKAILMDIEGTTSSISFVKEILFPYASEQIPSFLSEQADNPEVVLLLEEIRQVVGKPLNLNEIVSQLIHWMKEDAKVTPLKALQGMVWKEGYTRGDFFGHVYEDTVHLFKEWKTQGIALYLFSSGSIQAQQLLFAHTRYGDLTPLLSGYFDTRIGQKQIAASYHAILKYIRFPSESVLFLSDTEKELDAAREAGLITCHVVRSATTSAMASNHSKARTFYEVIV